MTDSSLADLCRECDQCGKTLPVASFRPQRRTCRRCLNDARNERRKTDSQLREQERKYRQENRESLYAQQRKWIESNRDRVNETARKSASRNRETCRERYKLWMRSNKERHAERNRNWSSANADKVRLKDRERYQRSSAEYKVRAARRRTIKKTLPESWSVAAATSSLSYWKYACAVCKTPFGLIAKLHWDHWIPLSSVKCPGTVPENMIPLCSHCNLSKHKADPSVWLLREFPSKQAELMQQIASYFSTLTLKDNQ